MSAQEDRAPLSTEVSPPDLQLSACAIEGHQDDPTQAAERLRKKTGRAHADISSDTVRLAIGQLLGGRYRIERELGEGGMGVVYLTADEQVLGERFAIKVLKEILHPEALTVLREEVRKTRKLSHPNIVDVHSVNVDGQRLYLLMEYLEGKSLDRLLDEEFGRGMPFSHAWPIIEDVAAALGNAHDHNVIHSDVKPANVFLTTSGRTKLLDFGIARVSRGPLLQARFGPRVLTPAYASCEMLEGKEADRRDDIYSFACVIHEMLCGERPFGEYTALEAREASTKVAPLEALSRGQNAALAHALAFDRGGRTGSVEQLLAGLGRAGEPRARRSVVIGAPIAAVAALGLTYFALDKLRESRHSVVVQHAGPDAAGVSKPAGLTSSVPAAGIHSLAVLPLENLSGDREQEYFADGMTDALITDLAQIGSLRVISRTSAMHFKGSKETLPQIGRDLKVDAVVEGSVTRGANRVRVIAQLVEASSDHHLWARTYERDLKDILALQDEIARDITEQIRVKLTPKERSLLITGHPIDPQAHDAYLKGSYWINQFTNQFTFEGLNKACDYFQKAVAKDPSYAVAYVGVAECFAFQNSPDKAREAVVKALVLDPSLAEAHMTLAAVKFYHDWDWSGAEAEFKQATALNPNYALAHHWYSRYLVAMGRLDEAMSEIERARELDPYSAIIASWVGQVLYHARRYDDALREERRALEMHPDSGDFYSDMADIYEQKKMFAEAFAARQQSLSLNKCPCVATLGEAYKRSGYKGYLLKQAETLGAGNPAYAAHVYALLNDEARAITALEKAYDERDVGLPFVRTAPELDSIRSSPRFRALVRRIGFPPLPSDKN